MFNFDWFVRISVMEVYTYWANGVRMKMDYSSPLNSINSKNVCGVSYSMQCAFVFTEFIYA